MRALARSSLLAAVLLGLGTTCAGGHTPSPLPAWPQNPETTVSYHLRLSRLGLRSALEVTMVVDWDMEQSDAALELAVPRRWGGAGDLDADLGPVSAWSADGQPLAVSRVSGRVAIEPPALGLRLGSLVTIRYEVTPRAHTLTGRSRFHAIGGPRFFFAYGRNLFMWPAHLPPASTLAEVVLEAGPADSAWATTLDASTAPHLVRVVSFADVANSALIAGQFRVVRGGVADHPILVVTDPQLAPIDDAVLLRARALVAELSTLFGEPPVHGTVVMVLRRADDPHALTGSGHAGGVVLEVGERVAAESPQLAILLAHETLHRYVGDWLRFSGRDELATLWFKEGVVEYIAARIVASGGLGTERGRLDAVSRVVTGYFSNDQLGTPIAERPDQGHWQSPDRRRLPYDLGFLVALHLDQMLSTRRDDLLSAVADLIRIHGGSAPLDNAALQAFFSERLGAGLDELFDLYISGRRPLPVRQWLAEAGLAPRQVREEAPYYGIVTAVSGSGEWRVSQIDPLGPAARLPIRVGDTLAEPPYVPTGGPTRPARYVVNRGGGTTVVAVQPVAGERLVWRVEPSLP